MSIVKKKLFYVFLFYQKITSLAIFLAPPIGCIRTIDWKRIREELEELKLSLGIQLLLREFNDVKNLFGKLILKIAILSPIFW